MSLFTVVFSYEARLPSEKARTWKRPADGVEIQFPELPERTATMALLEDAAGEVRAHVEVPESPMIKGLQSLPAGARIQLEVPDFPDAPIRARKVSRILPPVNPGKDK